MGNKATRGPPQGGVASQIAEPAQETAEAAGPAAKEEAAVASDLSDSPPSAELTTMLRKEKAHVLRLRDEQLTRMVAPDDLFGIALSGGGIRSATFSLGVLQALAQRGWIRKVDYLSTVSGGGYIGSWLSACIYRARKAAGATDAVAKIEKLITPRVSPDDARQKSSFCELTAAI